MQTETFINENGVEIQVHFDDLQYQLLERVDCYDASYECRGFDDNGNEYSGIANISCGECVNIEDIEQIN